MSAAQDRARKWLTGMGNWNPGIIRVSQGPEIVRDLLAELDQAQAVAEWLIAEKLWETRIEIDRLEIVNDWLVMRGVYPLEYPAGPEYGAMPYSDSEPLVHLSEIPGWDRTTLAAERDAALATLAEVREVVHRVGDFAIKDVDGIVAIAAILDRGPR